MAKSGYFFRVSPLDPHENKLKAVIQEWIKTNVFSRMVRNAIRLYDDLSNSKTDVLIELFPFVVDAICPRGTEDMDDLKRQMARMERLLEQRQIGIPEPAYKQSGAGVGTIVQGRAFTAAPSADDDLDDTIVLNKATASTNSNAAMASMMKVMF